MKTTVKEEVKFKPTLSKPVNAQSKGFEKNFSRTMTKFAPDVKLNEVDGTLTEAEQSLKKKIFSLAKMEALVFSDPKLSAVYEEMAENGEEKYGYHYNETIQNMIFNDYVLNSPKYLQKYKMAIPKEKKRRDQSGINQLKKAGEKKMAATGLPKQKKEPTPAPEVQETTGAASSGAYAGPAAWKKGGDLMEEPKVEESTTASSAGGAAGYVGYAGPAAWGSGELLKKGKTAPALRKPIWKGGTVIQESNYLTDPSGFEKFIEEINEQEYLDLGYQEELGKQYQQTHTGSNHGLGVRELNKSPEHDALRADIDANTELYVGQDVDRMSPKDVDILHYDMTEPNSMFPHPANPVLQDDGVLNSRYDNAGERNMTNKSPNRQVADNNIVDKTSAFTSDAIKHWDDGDVNVELNTLKTGQPDQPNLNAMEESKKINEKAKSASQQRLFGMAHAVQKGELSPSKVGGAVKKIAKDVSPKDVEDFAKTKHTDLPEKVDEETSQSMIAKPSVGSMANIATPTDDTGGNVPRGTQQTGGAMNESDMKLLEELNNELNAFSIHHQKLMKMTEDRRPSSLVLKDRLGNENEANFKKDLSHSGTKEIINVEKELQWKDQQTDVPKDPQKLGQDIENAEIKATDAKGDETLKNVGNSDNDKGDEIPKRNLTSEEQHEVDMYRLGQHSLVYDNEPSERFEDRMKSDMGDKIYKMRQEQLKFRGKAPMYNKDPQPVEDTTSDKVQFNKEQTGWNERVGLKETMVTGRFVDALGKKFIKDFRLNEVKVVKEAKEVEGMFQLDFTGFGNKYNSRTQDYKVRVNESIDSILSEGKYYTNGKEVFFVKNPVQKLNEVVQKETKPVVNEQVDKMKHLLGYKPENFTNTTNVKKNRGF